MKRKGILQTAFTLTATLLLAACTQDELADKQGEPLPEGKYPLTFTASIDGAAVAVTPQTRASVDGTFKDVDYIAVGIKDGSSEGFRNMVFKKDGVGATTWEYDGKISDDAEKPYWQSTNDEIQLRAWYFHQNENGEYYKRPENKDVYPGASDFSWSVQADQNNSDGYEKSDFLYAYDCVNFSTSYGGNRTLHFFHQTAKVVVHIIAGDQTPSDIADGSREITMTFGDPNSSRDRVYLAGKWLAPSVPWFEYHVGSFGTWSENKDKGVITPKSLGAITVNHESVKSLASYKAIVIPQDIYNGEAPFVINIEGYAPFYYRLTQNIMMWKPGTEHTYYITIKGSSLSVTTSENIGWTDGASGSGSVTFIGDKMAKDAEIGDFYMSDGTLVGKGATLTPEQKAACIGIVFQTDPNRIGKAEKDAGYTHGLVMAVKNAASHVTRGPLVTETELTNCRSWDACKNDISGLGNCRIIKALNDWSNYPAFKAAEDYKTACSAPANTTGWYLPAAGQLYDMFVNLGKLPTTEPDNSEYSYYWSAQAQTVADNLNNCMNSVTDKDNFELPQYFWSSSEYSYNCARDWALPSSNSVNCGFYTKNDSYDFYKVRAVLAF